MNDIDTTHAADENNEKMHPTVAPDNFPVSGSETSRNKPQARLLDWQTLTAVAALFISTVSIAMTLYSEFERKESESFSALISQSQSQEQMLMRHPVFLEFHGVDLDAAKRLDVDPQEIVYVLVELRQDVMFYKLAGVGEDLTPYRKETLRNPKFRLIYQEFLRGKLISPFSYTELMDEYIDELDSAAADK